MYCRNCGQLISNKSNKCTNCGIKRGLGENYCYKCGSIIKDKNKKNCKFCGANLSENKYIVNGKAKSKLLTIFLALFLGVMGIHRFYLGYIKIGTAQLILCILGLFTKGITLVIVAIWAFIEFVLIFINKIKDSNGNELE